PSGPTIAVVGLHQGTLDEADQQRAIEALVAAIENTGSYDALPPAQVATALAGREQVVLEEGLLAGARQGVANGRTSFNQASWEESTTYLANAIRDEEGVFPGANVVADLWDAWLYTGTAKLLQDEPDEGAAREAFVKAIALEPERPANPAQFPPDVVETFEKLRAELPAKAVTLGVAADGAGKAWLDGKEIGSVPANVQGVLPGVHYVLVRGDGLQGTARIEIPEVGDGGTPEPVQTRVSLQPPMLGTAATSTVGRSNQATALYTALARRTEGIDYVLIAGVDGDQLHLQLMHVQTATFSKALELPYADDADDEAAAAVPLLLPAIGPSGTFTTTAASAAPVAIGSNVALALLLTQPPEPAPIGPAAGTTKKRSALPVVLGVVGGAVVAGGVGTGAYFLTRGPTETTTPEGTVVIHF
ncbi:MAG: hypothetical protein KC621_31075, partial [Myxococcales bacterium]|nr:hypothetical protein [Myxococcales bacterium]